MIDKLAKLHYKKDKKHVFPFVRHSLSSIFAPCIIIGIFHIMKNCSIAALLFSLIFLFGSCAGDLGKDEDNNAGDCIITNVQLGGVKRPQHKRTAKGKDTVVIAMLAGERFPFSIDQANGQIFNIDSLPGDVDVSRTRFAKITATGSLSIQSLISGKDTAFVETDSLDFRQPRIVTVYGRDGVSRRKYTLKVNVHKEAGDSSTWKQLVSGNSLLASAEVKRAFLVNGEVYLYVLVGWQNFLLKSPLTDLSNWTQTAISDGSVSPASIHYYNGTFYATRGTYVVSSTDGLTWSPMGNVQPIAQILVVGSPGFVGLTSGQLYSSTDGINWTTDNMDTPSELPDAELDGLALQPQEGSNFDRFLLVGQRGGAARVWTRYIDKTNSEVFPWLYLITDAGNKQPCPALRNITLQPYAGGALLVGDGNDGKPAPFYLTEDGGRTWNPNALKRPNDIAATHSAALVVGGEVYLFCSGSGNVWKGKLNRAAWTKPQYSFTKGIR